MFRVTCHRVKMLKYVYATFVIMFYFTYHHGLHLLQVQRGWTIRDTESEVWRWAVSTVPAADRYGWTACTALVPRIRWSTVAAVNGASHVTRIRTMSPSAVLQVRSITNQLFA